MKKIKYPTTAKLKKKLWPIFSLYIRLKYADSKGYCRCVTCGRVLHYTDIQAGHFVDSRCNSVLFREEIVYPQCARCNIFLHGNKVKYTLFMLTKHSKDEIGFFEGLKNVVRKFTVEELEAKIKMYSKEVKRLKSKLKKI